MSNSDLPKLTKVCSSCGLEKPISAFLELSGDHTGQYGNVCGTCRKTYLEKSKAKDDGSSKTGTGHKIDSKAKVAGDIDRRAEAESREEKYHEERDDVEEEQTETLEKDALQKKDQRKHRESFLDRRSAFADKKTADDTVGKSHIASQEEAKEQANAADNAQDEEKRKGFDFAGGPVQDTYIAGKQKFSGVHIRQFATWVGKGSAIGRALGSKEIATQPEQQKDQTLTENLEERFGPGPGSKKR